MQSRLQNRHNLSVFMLLVAALCLRPEFSAAVGADLLTPAERAWLAAHPRIVLGVSDTWAPHVIKDKNGSFSGFIYDHMALLNQKLGSDFRIEAGPWGALVEKAKVREIDGLTLTAPLDERRAHFAFTDSFLTLDNLIYLRTEDHARPDAPETLDDLRGKRVGYEIVEAVVFGG